MTPDLIIDSTKLKKYAGPEPLTAVTASCCDSSTSSTKPVLESNSLVKSKSALVAKDPAEITDTPLPIWAGVLGITLTTGFFDLSRSSINLLVLPAAIEITNVSFFKLLLISLSTFSKS